MDRRTEVAIIFFIAVGGLIVVRESLGYQALMICLTITMWGAIILNQLEKLNGEE